MLSLNADDKAARISEIHPSPCNCEKIRTNIFSPGPVKDEEVLYWIVSEPNAIFENGKLNPIFLKQVDRKGLSVLRRDADDTEFEHSLIQLDKGWRLKGRYFHGIALFNTGNVRAFQDRGTQCMFVFDTAVQEKPHHADLFAKDLNIIDPSLDKKQQGREEKKRIKKFIDDVALDFEAATNFRFGKFETYARPKF